MEATDLRRRNEELEREVREGREREERVRLELELTTARLRSVEEAEERLCFELGEVEAEAAELAQTCHLRIRALSDELALALKAAGYNKS